MTLGCWASEEFLGASPWEIGIKKNCKLNIPNENESYLMFLDKPHCILKGKCDMGMSARIYTIEYVNSVYAIVSKKTE